MPKPWELQLRASVSGPLLVPTDFAETKPMKLPITAPSLCSGFDAIATCMGLVPIFPCRLEHGVDSFVKMRKMDVLECR